MHSKTTFLKKRDEKKKKKKRKYDIPKKRNKKKRKEIMEEWTCMKVEKSCLWVERNLVLQSVKNDFFIENKNHTSLVN